MSHYLYNIMPPEHLSIFDPVAVTTEVDTLPRCHLCCAGLLQLVKSPHAYVSIDHFCMVRLLVAYEMWIHECGDAKIRRDVSVLKILFASLQIKNGSKFTLQERGL